jgi:hypothetical protein
MKSIVVYKITIVTGFLFLATLLEAQKTGIDLISTFQQSRHPEAIIDTGSALNPTIRKTAKFEVPSVQKQNMTVQYEKKSSRMLGPSFDSLFHKEEHEKAHREKSAAKISFLNRKFNPLKILIYITTIN